MCPSLSRKNFFVTVLNQCTKEPVKTDCIEKEIETLLLEIANLVKGQLPIKIEIISKANTLFKQHNPIYLRVAMVTTSDDLHQSHYLLHTEYRDRSTLLKRILMEGLISIFEAIENGELQLQQCIQCGKWFIPYKRAQVTKFCGSKCRNRYHYVNKRQTKKEVNL